MIIEERNEPVSKKWAYCFLIFSNVFYAVIPLFFLIIASFTITKCPANQFLPLWLVGVAILIIVDRVIFWKILYNEINFEKNFPRPECNDFEEIRAWEKKRGKSSSSLLVLLKTNLRIVFFGSLLFGLIWSHDLLFKEDMCKPIVVFTIFGFSFVSLVFYLVSFVGTIYIHCVAWLSRMDQKAKCALNRVL